jgi:hypothetical protein
MNVFLQIANKLGFQKKKNISNINHRKENNGMRRFLMQN